MVISIGHTEINQHIMHDTSYGVARTVSLIVPHKP